MKPKLILCLALVLSGFLIGCASASAPRASAIARAKPFVVALKAYHRDTGDYPQQLADLRPQYLPADVPIYDNSDARHSWLLNYQRVDQNDYKLYLDSSPCSQAMFTNGMFVAGYGPNYK
jgi:hypothetical protein